MFNFKSKKELTHRTQIMSTTTQDKLNMSGIGADGLPMGFTSFSNDLLNSSVLSTGKAPANMSFACENKQEEDQQDGDAAPPTNNYNN